MLRLLENNKIKKTGLILALFIFTFFIVSLYIPTHDDYSIPFGNDIAGSIDNARQLGNGRYLGNFLGNYLTLKQPYNAIFKTVILVGIISLTAYLVDGITPKSLAISVLLFEFPSFGLYSQCYIWSMGFYNYTIPLALFLASMAILKRNWARNENISFFELVILFVLGISQMLFSENTTVVLLIIAILTSIYAVRKKAIKNATYLYLVATIIGTIIMFLVPRILGGTQITDNYRSLLLPNGSISIYLLSLLERISILQGYVIGFLIFWAVLVVTILKKRIDCGNKSRAIIDVIVVMILYCLVFLLKEHIIPISKWNYTNLLIVIIATVLEVYVIWIILKLYNDKHQKLVIVCLLLAVLSVAELIPVNPIGERCLFTTYVFLAFLAVVLASETFKDNGTVWGVVFLIAIVVIYDILFVNLKVINAIYKEKISYIEQQIAEKKSTIEVIELPDTGLLWYPNSNYGLKYIYNYGIPGDITFENIPYEEYKNEQSDN